MSKLSPDEELLQLIAENQYYPDRLAMILWKWGEGELDFSEKTASALASSGKEVGKGN